MHVTLTYIAESEGPIHLLLSVDRAFLMWPSGLSP